MPSAAHPVTLERIARHGFATRPAGSVVDAVRLTTAIQAQDPAQARLGVRSRATGVTEADVQDAIADHSVVRTWLMRGTVHLVAADDVRWLSALFGPALQRRFAKRWLDLGLTAQVLAPITATIPDVLASGPRSRKDIIAALAEQHLVPDSPDPQAVATHILLHATSVGLLCRATDRGRDALFTLLDDWTAGRPDGPRGDDALAELARRYFAAFAPATAKDFTVWSGLGSARAIELIRDELVAVDVAGRPGFRPATPDMPEQARGTVRLVAGYDNYLVGYADRSLLLDDEHRAAVYVGGVIKPCVLVDGRIAGIWRLTRQRGDVSVAVTPLRPLTKRTTAAVEREIADIRRFVASADAGGVHSP